MREPLQINERILIPATELHWTAVRASGPGGQNVNKVSSKVELRFDLLRSVALKGDVKARLRALVGKRMDAEGQVVITSQVTRDQARNLDDAREKLATLVREALFVPKVRRATKPTKGSQRRRLEGKHITSQKKQQRRGVSGGDD
jgi:ribosome-associated protein